MKAHILVFDATQVDRKTMQRAIDRLATVANWVAFFDNAMCLASETSVDDLSRQIRDQFPTLVFMITAVDVGATAGWLPKAIWSFVADPKPANVEAA